MASDREWAERRLCDDGACTGVIGSDGMCRVCGRASRFWGDERRRGMLAADDGGDDMADEVDAARVRNAARVKAGKAAKGKAAGASEDDERVLCVDGGCVGLVGADGTCKVCGLPGPAGRAMAPTNGVDDGDGDGDGDDDDDDELDDDDDPDDEYDDDGAADDDEDDDDEDDDGAEPAAAASDDDRKLCPDGGCIGVLDARGVCKVCGKSDAGN